MQSVSSVANRVAQVVWRKSQVDKQCVAQLSYMAAVEARDGGLCLSGSGC